jgi:site-specific DNA recombinase
VQGKSLRAEGKTPRQRGPHQWLIVNLRHYIIFAKNHIMNKKEQCVIYARVSTIDKQDFIRQIHDLERHANYLGFDVANTFSEKVSGTVKATSRREFVNMVEYIEKHKIKHLLISELSRLGRTMRDTIQTIQEFNDKKICIHILKDNQSTLDKNFEENKITSLIINILISFADMERDLLIDRVKSGIRNSIRNQGAGQGSIKPFGYKKHGTKLIIDEREAQIVKLIFAKYIEGFGSHHIANYLNSQKIETRYNILFDKKKVIKTRGGRLKNAESFVWRDTTVIGIIKNTIYIGQRKHKGEVFEIPPIIDPEKYHIAQAIRKGRYNAQSNSRKYENIFSGKIKCPQCGSGYYMHKRHNNRDNAYRCLSHRLKEVKCDNISVNIDKLNNAVYAILKDSFLLRSAHEQIGEFKEKVLLEANALKLEIEQLSNAIAKEEKLQERLTENYLEEVINRNVFKKLNLKYIDSLEKHNQKLLQKQKQQVEIENSILNLTNARNKDFLNVDIFKTYIKDFIESIAVHDVTNLVRMGTLGSHFKTKNDVIALVEVKSNLIESYTTFLISRYSNILVKLNLLDIKYLDRKLPYMEEGSEALNNDLQGMEGDYVVGTIGKEITIKG